MYQIRVRPGSDALEATFSEELTARESLRAISQAFALANAGAVARALCDIRGVSSGPPVEALAPIAASLRARLGTGQRVALLCWPAQLALVRRFARAASGGCEVGVFTRDEDARQWLESAAGQRLSTTAMRHLRADPNAAAEAPESGKRRRSA